MRLWTIQSAELYERLKQEKALYCGADRLPEITDSGFLTAYWWMAEQMCNRIGPPPSGATFPFWAWHTWDWKQKKPDFRYSEFRHFQSPQVCIELKLEKNQVLLSNEDMWHIVLNDGYYGRSEQEWQWFEALAHTEQRQAKRSSWQRIFDVSPLKENQWECHGRYVQAVFWGLNISQVVKVQPLKGTETKGFAVP